MQNLEEPKSNHAESKIQPKSNRSDLPHQNSIAKPIGIHPHFHHARRCHDLIVIHADLHQTHHQSEQPKNLATPDLNTGDLWRPTKPSNTGLKRTITHNPLQPYPPLPLSIGYSKKKKKTIETTDPLPIHRCGGPTTGTKRESESWEKFTEREGDEM